VSTSTMKGSSSPISSRPSSSALSRFRRLALLAGGYVRPTILTTILDTVAASTRR